MLAVRKVWHGLVPARWRADVRGALQTPKTRDRLAPEFEAELVETFADDVAETSELLGRDLSHWLARPRPAAAAE
jgi:hypothetical protein